MKTNYFLKANVSSKSLFYILTLFMLGYSSVFSQANSPDVYSTPKGYFDKVFDKDGIPHKLSDIAAGRTSVSSTGEVSNSTLLCTSGIFALYFETDCGMEILGNQVHDQRRAIICQVFQDISDFINTPLKNPGNSNKVRIWIRNPANLTPPIPAAAAGGASAYYSLPVASSLFNSYSGIVDNEIWKTIHTGIDSYSNTVFPIAGTSQITPFYHGYASFNFSGTANWNLDYNVYDSNTNYVINSIDFYTTILHEVIHALGFNSLLNYSGVSMISNDVNGSFSNYFTRYDKNLITTSGVSLIHNTPSTDGAMYGYALNLSIQSTLYPSCSLTPPTYNIDSGLYNCPTAIRYSSPSLVVPVYNPPCFERGSSLSHFEDACYNGQTNDQYFVMSERASGLHAKRALTSEERLVLCDIGYSVKGSYGNSSNHTYKNYGVDDCGGIQIGGVNDGLNSMGGFTFQGDSGSTILINGILNNDYTGGSINDLRFELVQDMYDQSSNIITTGGNSSSSIQFSSVNPGVHLLRYVPYDNVTGARGNITYIFVNVINHCVVNSVCNLVRNGAFEEHSSPPNNAGQIEKSCGWQNVGFTSTADYFNSDSTTPSDNIPCNMMGYQDDQIAGNHSYIGMFVKTSYSETIKTELQQPLLINTTYQLKFDVSLSESMSNSSIKFQAYLTDQDIHFTNHGILFSTDILPTSIFLTNTNFSNAASSGSNGWETITFNFTTGTNPNLRYLILGGINGVTFHTESVLLPMPNPPCIVPFIYPDQGSYYYVDNVRLMPVNGITPTFAQVAPICTGAILSPLPTTSLNGITGSWSPALSNTATTTYTFTPNGGQCVTSTVVTMTITVSAPPVITSISPSTQKVCINTSPIPLVVTVTGSPITYQWYSNLTNTTVGGTLIAGATMASYTPPTSEAKTKYYYVVVSKNGCSVTSSLVVVKVTNLISPQFFDLQSTVYCDTDFPISLPNTSENGIGGVWHVGTSSGAIVTTAATGGSYTFVPNAGQCARSIAVTVSTQSLSMYTINNDYFTPGYPSTSLTTASVINNDQYMGNYLGGGFTPAGVSYYAQLVGAVPTFSSGGITMNSSGVFTIQAGTTGGVYTFHYVLQTDCGTTTQGEVTIVVQAYIQSYKMSFSFCYNSISSVQNNNGTGNSSLFNTTTIAGQPANSSNAIIEVQTPGGYPPFITVFADGTFAIAPGTPPSSVSFNIRVCSIGGVNCGDWVPCDIHIQTSVKGEADYLTYDTNGNLISPTVGAYNVLSNDSVIQCPYVLVPAVLGANANVLFTSIAPTNPIPFSISSTGLIFPLLTTSNISEGNYYLSYTICDVQNPTHCVSTSVWITVVAPSPFTGTINSVQNEQNKQNIQSSQSLISEKNGLQIINFPDPNLKARLLSGACCSDYPLNTTNIVDLNGDGEIDTSEALTIGLMNLSASNISNLTGLQYFFNLKRLWIASNPISVLDYNVIPVGLESFGPFNIPIQSIDTSHFPNLIVLSVNGTQISDLDLETNHALNLLALKDCPNISSVILKNGSVQDVSDTTNGCWSNCPNLVTVCTDANELAAVEGFLTTCGYNLSSMNVNSSCVLGTEGFTNEGGFSVAPNPSKGVFELRFSESIEGSVSVYTILGQRIVYTELNGSVLGLQLSDYPSGSYMIVVESGDKVMHQMVVKE